MSFFENTKRQILLDIPSGKSTCQATSRSVTFLSDSSEQYLPTSSNALVNVSLYVRLPILGRSITVTPLLAYLCLSSSKTTLTDYQCVSTGCCTHVAKTEITIDNQHVTKSLQRYGFLPKQPKENTEKITNLQHFLDFDWL